MTLENKLRQQLNSPESGGFHIEAGGWSITVSADRRDSLSCALKELSLSKAEPVKESLKAWADRIADRATGLMEPLRVIEVDAPIGKALLRSESPSVHAGKSHYYELTLERSTRSSALLRRYVGSHGEKRESVPFALTNDAIVKLVMDVVGGN